MSAPFIFIIFKKPCVIPQLERVITSHNIDDPILVMGYNKNDSLFLMSVRVLKNTTWFVFTRTRLLGFVSHDHDEGLSINGHFIKGCEHKKGFYNLWPLQILKVLRKIKMIVGCNGRDISVQ